MDFFGFLDVNSVTFTDAQLDLIDLSIAEARHEIFVELLTFVLAISSIFLAIFGGFTFVALRRSANALVESKVDESISLAVMISSAWSLNENALVWWSEYEEVLQKKRRGDTLSVEDLRKFTTNIESADRCISLALNYIETFDHDFEKYFKGRPILKKAYIQLLNHSVYIDVTRQIVEGTIYTSAKIDEIVEVCAKILQLSCDRDMRSKRFEWYESYETVGFAKYYLAEQISSREKADSLRKEGASMLRALAENNKPRSRMIDVPAEFSEQVRQQHSEALLVPAD